jgi:hypothetical protein
MLLCNFKNIHDALQIALILNTCPNKIGAHPTRENERVARESVRIILPPSSIFSPFSPILSRISSVTALTCLKFASPAFIQLSLVMRLSMSRGLFASQLTSCRARLLPTSASAAQSCSDAMRKCSALPCRSTAGWESTLVLSAYRRRSSAASSLRPKAWIHVRQATKIVPRSPVDLQT